MKFLRAAISILFSLLFVFGTLAEEAGEKLVILHTNDLHSRLDGFAPTSQYSPLSVNDDNTIGGFSRLATLIQKEKGLNPDRLLVLDDGDFLMGTIYHITEEVNGFQLPLMKEMGYDLVAIGNHEFDFGPEKLYSILEKSAATGEIPGLLLTNAVFNKDDSRDDGIEELFNKELIKRTVILRRGGLNIGIFSLMGIDADEVAPLAEPLTFMKQKKTARKAVRQLRKEGADIVICLSHSGIEKNKKGKWSGEDVKLAKKVKGLDLIISGHTHSKLEKPLQIKNSLVVQAGSFGAYLGRMELMVSDDKVELLSYDLIPVDDSIKGDERIQSLIDNQKSYINEKIFGPLGYDPSSSLINSSFELTCDEYGGDLENSNLGPLVVDAIHTYINTRSNPGTDITMVATGVIRDRIPPGLLSVQDVFRVMSLGSGSDNVPGYPLATVYLTGLEIKRVMEILLVTYKSSPGNYCYYSGIEVDLDPDKGLLRKINAMYHLDGEGNRSVIDISKNSNQLYSVSANAYMLEFVGIIKKTTFGLVNVIPKLADGTPVEDMSATHIDFDLGTHGIQEGKEWIALVEYLKMMDDQDDDGIPELDEFYRSPPLRLKPVMAE